MNCPECGQYIPLKGDCDRCGFRPSDAMREEAAQKLLRKVGDGINRTQRAIEWGGVEKP